MNSSSAAGIRENLPQDFRDVVIITLYKNKGEVWLLQLSRDNTAPYRRQNLSKSIGE